MSPEMRPQEGREAWTLDSGPVKREFYGRWLDWDTAGWWPEAQPPD